MLWKLLFLRKSVSTFWRENSNMGKISHESLTFEQNLPLTISEYRRSIWCRSDRTCQKESKVAFDGFSFHHGECILRFHHQIRPCLFFCDDVVYDAEWWKSDRVLLASIFVLFPNRLWYKSGEGFQVSLFLPRWLSIFQKKVQTNNLLRHSVEILRFFFHLDFTWNQFWII